jgi:hypothetical protein
VVRKFLPHIAQAPNHYRLIHMTVQVFQNERRTNRDSLQVAEHLGWLLAAVDRFRAGERFLSCRAVRGG